MWAIVDRLKEFRYGMLRKPNGYCKVAHHAYVGLPFVTEQEWRQRFDANLSAPKWEIVFSTDLEPAPLRQRLTDVPTGQRCELTEEEWDATVAVLRGSEAIQKVPRRPAKRPDNKAAWLRQVEQKMRAFDLEQHRVAVQVPAGPQRIRGLAGTGKTVVLAQKAAFMHVNYPEWNIVFSFYSRSLYGQVRYYIQQFVQEFSRGALTEPDWSKIRVLHGWGSRDQPGVYRELCTLTDTPFRNYGDAISYFDTTSGNYAFDKCCEEWLATGDVAQLFDAILVDEAQDFGKFYLRLCYHALRQPKRLIWGYDEIQSLDELEIPTAEQLFGKDSDGNALVDLDGEYPGEIEKDMILYHCYRNPRPVLVAAHAFGLGLRRKGGAIQFINTVGGWQDIGYEVRQAKGNELQTGEEITLYRPESNSPHLLEKLAGYHQLVTHHLFESRGDELDWIISDVLRNIRDEELRPDEIAILALDSRKQVADQEYQRLFKGLITNGVKAARIGYDSPPDVFRVEDAVTITSAYRAKGNEASLVYVYGFDHVGQRWRDYQVIRARNLAFTAMTRTRGWLVLTGVGDAAEQQFEEIDACLEQIGCVSFIVPDMQKIQRNLETYENQRRRTRIRQAEKSIRKTIENLADVNPDDLSPELKRQIFRLLFRDQGRGEA